MVTETTDPILTLRGIHKSYGPIEVLHGIDLDIKAGEVVALLGENGAGKSTVSNIISGTVLPSSGNMMWQGAPFAPATPREAIDAGVGMIHQELLLLPHLSIAENLFVGRYPMKAGRVDRKEMERRAQFGLERLGLDISPKRVVEGLSTASQQLIEIAKALTLNAKLLILDEPTQGLDQPGEERFYALLAEIREETGVAIFMVSHDLHVVMAQSDRVICLNTHICCSGAPEHVEQDPSYHALFGARATLAPYQHHHHEHCDHD